MGEYRTDARAQVARSAFWGREGYDALAEFIARRVGAVDEETGSTTGFTLEDAMRVVDGLSDEDFAAIRLGG